MIATINKRGFTYKLTSIGEKFVDFASVTGGPVLDVGAAFGVATVPALEAGAEVYALDVEGQHLYEIAESVSITQRQRLHCVEGRFPDIDFPDGHFTGIYISQVFPFLTGEEIEQAARKMHNWLTADGKIFIVSFTPFIKHVASYLPIYYQKKEAGIPWAGFIDDLPAFSYDNPIAKNLPSRINHVDMDDLRRVFEEHFHIEELDYIRDGGDGLPEGIRYDGRERVGLIARKRS